MTTHLLAARPEGLLPLFLEPLIHMDALGVSEVAVRLERVEEVRPRGLGPPPRAGLGCGQAVKGMVDLEGIEVRGVVLKLAGGRGERVEVVGLRLGGVPVLVGAPRAANEEPCGRQRGQEVKGLFVRSVGRSVGWLWCTRI
jgi:hypothetical protein